MLSGLTWTRESDYLREARGSFRLTLLLLGVGSLPVLSLDFEYEGLLTTIGFENKFLFVNILASTLKVFPKSPFFSSLGFCCCAPLKLKLNAFLVG